MEIKPEPTEVDQLQLNINDAISQIQRLSREARQSFGRLGEEIDQKDKDLVQFRVETKEQRKEMVKKHSDLI